MCCLPHWVFYVKYNFESPIHYILNQLVLLSFVCYRYDEFSQAHSTRKALYLLRRKYQISRNPAKWASVVAIYTSSMLTLYLVFICLAFWCKMWVEIWLTSNLLFNLCEIWTIYWLILLATRNYLAWLILNNQVFLIFIHRTWKAEGGIISFGKLWSVSHRAVCQISWNTWRDSTSKNTNSAHLGWFTMSLVIFIQFLKVKFCMKK